MTQIYCAVTYISCAGRALVFEIDSQPILVSVRFVQNTLWVGFRQHKQNRRLSSNSVGGGSRQPMGGFDPLNPSKSDDVFSASVKHITI